MKAGSIAEDTPSAQRPEPLHYAKKAGFTQLGNSERVFMWLSGIGISWFAAITCVMCLFSQLTFRGCPAIWPESSATIRLRDLHFEALLVRDELAMFKVAS